MSIRRTLVRVARRWPLAAQVGLVRVAGAVGRRLGFMDRDYEPGQLFLQIRPDGIGLVARRLRGSVVVSATNGKTTTTDLVAAVLGRHGESPVHNESGANLPAGVATALLERSVPRRGTGGFGVFEIDEGWLPKLVPQLEPRAILLGNLFRDQLDRFGEVESVAAKWDPVVAALAPRTAFVLNADDPLVAGLGRHCREVLYYGLGNVSHAVQGPERATDARHCWRCGAAVEYEVKFLAHLGHYRCASCGWERPQPQVAAERVELEGSDGTRLRLRTPSGTAVVRLPLPGLHNAWNAAAAAALGVAVGVRLEDIVAALENAVPAWGRGEVIPCNGRPVVLTLFKNPPAANSVLQTLGLQDGEIDLLGAMNDYPMDGLEDSWIWNVNFEALAPGVRRVTCCGTRAAELAVRFKYAGVPAERIAMEPDVAAAVQLAITSGAGPIQAFAAYSASLLALREALLAQADGAGRPGQESNPASPDGE